MDGICFQMQPKTKWVIGTSTRQHKDVDAFFKNFAKWASSNDDATRTPHGHGL
jgi:hypothetical protein